jgi:hypothetical protein
LDGHCEERRRAGQPFRGRSTAAIMTWCAGAWVARAPDRRLNSRWHAALLAHLRRDDDDDDDARKSEDDIDRSAAAAAAAVAAAADVID